MQKKEMAGLMVIAAGCLWGVIGLFSRKLSAVGFDAVQITALRSLVTAAGLFLLLFCKDRKLCRIDLERPMDVLRHRHLQHCRIQHLLLCDHQHHHIVRGSYPPLYSAFFRYGIVCGAVS